MLLNEAIKEFKYYITISNKSKETLKGYTKDMNAFQRFLEQKYNGPVYLEEIKVMDIEDYLYSLKLKKLQSASRSRNLYTLRSFWSFAFKNKFCDSNLASVVESIKVNRKERTYLSEEEVEILLKNLEHPLINLVVKTLFFTGMRIGECINLKISDVDFKNKLIKIINGKGGKDRNIPINNKLMPVLESYLENDRDSIESSYFFATHKSGHLSGAYVNRVIDDTVKALGWDKQVSAHILRHSFASNLIKKGVNIVHVQKLLGHSNLKVTSIYTHANVDELSDSINMM